MSFNFGKNIRCTIFGQSHSDAIGVVIDGLPPGVPIKEESIKDFLARRAPGNNPWSTPRKEEDIPRILSGIFEGKTCGSPFCAVIENTNTQSKDYEKAKNLPRPSHSDFPAFIKYKGFHDYRGGGHFSGRLTAPLCIAGAICKGILAKEGIVIGAHIASIGSVQDKPFDPIHINKDILEFPGKMEFPVQNQAIGETMKAKIMLAKEKMDSVGGIIEGCAIGLPVGMGEPIFDTLEGALAKAAFAIPAVRGVEFGLGFAAAEKKGSTHNDAYTIEEDTIKTITNHHGGILGGLSTGMPLIMRIAIKPTPSIGISQRTFDLTTKKPTDIAIKGRHDPCIVPRAVPVLESIMAITLLDYLIESRKITWS